MAMKNRFEETYRKMEEKYGGKKEEEEKKKKSSSSSGSGSSSSGSKSSSSSNYITHGALAGNSSDLATKYTTKKKKQDRFEETYKEMESRYNKSASVDQDYVNSFLRDAQSFLSKTVTKLNNISWNDAT